MENKADRLINSYIITKPARITEALAKLLSQVQIVCLINGVFAATSNLHKDPLLSSLDRLQSIAIGNISFLEACRSPGTVRFLILSGFIYVFLRTLLHILLNIFSLKNWSVPVSVKSAFQTWSFMNTQLLYVPLFNLFSFMRKEESSCTEDSLFQVSAAKTLCYIGMALFFLDCGVCSALSFHVMSHKEKNYLATRSSAPDFLDCITKSILMASTFLEFGQNNQPLSFFLSAAILLFIKINLIYLLGYFFEVVQIKFQEPNSALSCSDFFSKVVIIAMF